MDLRGRDRLAVGRLHGHRRRRVREDRDLEAAVRRLARGRVHAHLRHEPGEEHALHAPRAQQLLERRAGERARQVLRDDGLARRRARGGGAGGWTSSAGLPGAKIAAPAFRLSWTTWITGSPWARAHASASAIRSTAGGPPGGPSLPAGAKYSCCASMTMSATIVCSYLPPATGDRRGTARGRSSIVRLTTQATSRIADAGAEAAPRPPRRPERKEP